MFLHIQRERVSTKDRHANTHDEKGYPPRQSEWAYFPTSEARPRVGIACVVTVLATNSLNMSVAVVSLLLSHHYD